MKDTSKPRTVRPNTLVNKTIVETCGFHLKDGDESMMEGMEEEDISNEQLHQQPNSQSLKESSSSLPVSGPPPRQHRVK